VVQTGWNGKASRNTENGVLTKTSSIIKSRKEANEEHIQSNKDYISLQYFLRRF